MRLADKILQDMTDEFVTRFLAMAHVLNQEEHPEKEAAAGSHDGYAFNYELAECLAHSGFAVKQAREREDFPLIGSGFASNVVKGFFANSILGIKDDVAFVIANFKNQDTNLDYYVRDLKDNTEEMVVDAINVEFHTKGTGEKTVKKEETHRTASFTVHNTKNGYTGKCTILYVNGQFSKMEVYGEGGKQLTVNRNEEPTIEHFKHVADINSFFMMIEQVRLGIQDTLKEQ